MKTYLLTMILLIVVVSVSSARQGPDQSQAWNKYQAEKKSELTAGVLEALIPVVGHAYAGDAGRGVIPAIVSVGGLVVMIAGAGNLDATVISLGYLGYLGGRVWGIVSAVQTAEDFNVRLKQQMKLSIRMRPTGLQLGLSYEF